MIEIDPNAPIASLKKAGATCSLSQVHEGLPFRSDGVEFSGTTVTGLRYEWTLPAPADVEAAFVAEQFKHKLAKVFSAELQTDDPAFDEAVYIKTRDYMDTANFLADERIREIVYRVITGGGTIAVEGAEVSYPFIEEDASRAELEADMAYFVAALMARAPNNPIL